MLDADHVKKFTMLKAMIDVCTEGYGTQKGIKGGIYQITK
jgi:hypothetical protein